MELARHRSSLCERTRIARGAGIACPFNAALSERPIPVVSTRVGGQIDGAFSRKKSATTVERRTADVPNDANRRRVGARRKIRRPGSAQRAKHERDEFFVESEACRFQKDQNQSAGRVSVRLTSAESLMIRHGRCR